MILTNSKKVLLDEDKYYFKGYSIKLFPTEDQSKFLKKSIDLYRKVYNWTKEKIDNHVMLYKYDLEENKYPDTFEIQSLLSEYRNQNEWLQEIPLTTCRLAMLSCFSAYKKYEDDRFRPRKNTKRLKHLGIPKFKSKKNSKQMFKFRNDKGKFYFDGSKVRIEGLPFGDRIETKFKNNPFSRETKFYNTSIHLSSTGEFILSFQIVESKDDTIYNDIPKYDRAIGIDLNVDNLIVTSYGDGEKLKTPNIKNKIKSLKRAQRKCQNDRDKYIEKEKEIASELNVEIANLPDEYLPIKSNNCLKREKVLAKRYRKVSNIMDNFIRTTVKKIVLRNPKAIVLEDLHVREMKSKRYISVHLGNYISFAKVRHIFEYNCNKYGIPVIIADRYYPSSGTCSVCGHKKNIYSEHYFCCPNCHSIIDRDINAAFNLEHYYDNLLNM